MKRRIALLVSVIMILAILPTGVFANPLQSPDWIVNHANNVSSVVSQSVTPSTSGLNSRMDRDWAWLQGNPSAEALLASGPNGTVNHVLANMPEEALFSLFEIFNIAFGWGLLIPGSNPRAVGTAGELGGAGADGNGSPGAAGVVPTGAAGVVPTGAAGEIPPELADFVRLFGLDNGASTGTSPPSEGGSSDSNAPSDSGSSDSSSGSSDSSSSDSSAPSDSGSSDSSSSDSSSSSSDSSSSSSDSSSSGSSDSSSSSSDSSSSGSSDSSSGSSDGGGSADTTAPVE